MGFIYWIASYPKSGNTWTRAFLSALITGRPSNPDRFIPDERDGTFYQPHLTKPIEEANTAELAYVRPKAHRLAAGNAPNFLLLKTHAMMAIHNGTSTITPDVTAGVIYVLRNPLDVAVSYAGATRRGLDETIALMNTTDRVPARKKSASYEPCGSWQQNVVSWTKPHDRKIVARYEDIAADPFKEFSRMAAFLRMDTTREQVQLAVDQSSGDDKYRSGYVGQWRDKLSDEQVAAVARPNEALMKRFGYWLDEFDELVDSPAASSG